MFQSRTFWFQHIGLMRPPPKFGTCEIFPKFFPRQKLEQFEFAHIRGHLCQTVVYRPLSYLFLQQTSAKPCGALDILIARNVSQ